MTNSERIRAMSDEELARFIGYISDCCGCPAGITLDCSAKCQEHLVSYLQSEADENDDCFLFTQEVNQ